METHEAQGGTAFRYAKDPRGQCRIISTNTSQVLIVPMADMLEFAELFHPQFSAEPVDGAQFIVLPNGDVVRASAIVAVRREYNQLFIDVSGGLTPSVCLGDEDQAREFQNTLISKLTGQQFTSPPESQQTGPDPDSP